MVQRMNVSLMISRRLRIAGSGRGPSRSGFVVAVAGVALALAVMMLSVAESPPRLGPSAHFGGGGGGLQGCYQDQSGRI